MAAPLVDGAVSLVIYKDGAATVAQWKCDAQITSSPAAVRQNLRLIVDQGQVTPDVEADNFRIWGKTVGNAAMVWRSGVGSREMAHRFLMPDERDFIAVFMRSELAPAS